MRIANIPGVIHIGYMRSGSTYLRSYFTQHPDIHWTRKAWFFQLKSDDDIRKKQYLDFFKNESAHSCFIDMYEGLSLGYTLTNTPEKDYSNTIHPEWDPIWALKIGAPMDGTVIVPNHAELARRIKQVLPDSKVLIVLRNQISWLRSMYLHFIEYFPPSQRRFTDFIDTLEGKTTLSSACYHETLDAYSSYFRRSNIHVLLLEELACEENRVLNDLCTFLGIPFHAMDKGKANQNEGRKVLPPGLSIESKNELPGVLKKLFNKPSRLPTQMDLLSESEKAFIRSYYSVSNYKTAKWIGQDLARWGYSG